MRKKQVAVLVLVLVIIAAGVLQYNYNKSGDSLLTGNVKENQNDHIGEAIYVDNTDLSGLSGNKSIASSTGADLNKQDSNSATVASQLDGAGELGSLLNNNSLENLSDESEYFAQARLEKGQSRAKQEDALKSITKDESASIDIKNKAYEQMMNVISNTDKETKIETLIKQRGFKDVLVILSDDGSMDVIVNAPSLNDSQTAQICDIVERHAGIKMENIFIKKVWNSKE